MNPVICGVDAWDSESGSAGTVHQARDLARQFERPLLFVTVIDADSDEKNRAGAGALLRHVTETSHDVDASWTVEEGHPADRLVALAGEREASFLVVGNHGPRSSLLGSVSADVARRAPCPVVVVPRAVTEV
ncbi:MAG TPA: universal stress protein [Solirubrobacteraceae bacterium]|nr:universal stress protein [Solirubrobacteraceae bacterium]